MKITTQAALLALCFAASLNAVEIFYTQLIESKPVELNGLQFVAATEEKWVCFNPPLGEDPIQVQLLIRNTTSQPLLFSVFDTFEVSIKNSAGKEIPARGGCDGTLRTKPVVIPAGASYCLSRMATLRWNPDGKSRTLTYRDGTGSIATYGPLPAGKYTLSFWCERSPNSTLDQRGVAITPAFTQWYGKIATKEVTFEIIDP